MTEIEKAILLNQGIILTALAEILDKIGSRGISKSSDEASERVIKFVKSFDRDE